MIGRGLFQHPLRGVRLMGHFYIGDSVEVYLSQKYWKQAGWYPGTIVRIEPYSQHRNFYWVKLDRPVQSKRGIMTDQISVLNLKKMRSRED